MLVLDCSFSMAKSGAIGQLRGLSLLERSLKGDDDTADGVQIAVIRMGGWDEVTELTGFVDAADFQAPAVEANGSTPLGSAVDRAMMMIEEQKQRYRQNGISYKRPWLWVMSDGAPTDEWQYVAQRARDAQTDKRFTLWAIGIGDQAPLEVLKAFTNGDRCFRLAERNIRDMFEFMSASMSAGSRAAAGQQIALPPRPEAMIEPLTAGEDPNRDLRRLQRRVARGGRQRPGTGACGDRPATGRCLRHRHRRGLRDCRALRWCWVRIASPQRVPWASLRASCSLWRWRRHTGPDKLGRPVRGLRSLRASIGIAPRSSSRGCPSETTTRPCSPPR